jgi:hypothetical protein
MHCPTCHGRRYYFRHGSVTEICAECHGTGHVAGCSDEAGINPPNVYEPETIMCLCDACRGAANQDGRPYVGAVDKAAPKIAVTQPVPVRNDTG